MNQEPESTFDSGAEKPDCRRINGGEYGLAAIVAMILFDGFGCLTIPLL